MTFITSDEAAALLSIKLATLYKRRQLGTLGIEPVYHFGQALMWSREEVEHLARQRKGKAA